MLILGLIELPFWLVAILTFVGPIIAYTLYKRNTFKRLGITTKPSTFLIGDFGEIGKKGLTFYNVEMINQYGKVFGTFWGNEPMLVTADTEMVKQIFVKHFSSFTERFRMKSKPKGMNSSVSVAEGVHWKYLRNTLSPCFTTGKLKNMNSHVGSCLENLIKNIDDKTTENPDGFDIFPVLRAFTLDVICKTGFGVDVDSQRDPDNPWVRNATAVTNSDFMRHPVVILNFFFPDFPGLEKIEMNVTPKGPRDFFREACKSLFEERKTSDSPHVDLLQTMVNAHKEDDNEEVTAFERRALSLDQLKREGLTDDEVITNSLVFIVAGFETTATTLAWWAYDMAVNTECQEKLIQEIDKEIGKEEPTYESTMKLRYMDMVLNETMRMHPVAALLTRQAVEDTTVCGVHIPKGMCVLVPAFALHLNPEYWEEPEQYNPERFAPENKDSFNEYAFLPFGQGPRNCIGLRLAQLEMKMTIVSLLLKYRIVRTDKLMVPMEGAKKGFYKPDKPVYVKFEKREITK